MTDRRFEAMVDRSSGQGPWGDCHLWIGYTLPNGYGKLTRHRDGVREELLAHRYAFRLEHGFDPPEVDHKCEVKACVNTRHLQGVGTHEHRIITAARRPNCVNGHPWRPETTYTRPDGRGRECLVCRSERNRARYR